MKSAIQTASLLALLLLAPPALLAFDATGTWEGQWSCKEFDGTKFTSKQKPSTLLISQNGATVATDIDGGSYVHDGHAIDDLKKPTEKGEMLLVDCVSDNDAESGFGEIIRVVIKVKPDKGTGTFSGISVYQDVDMTGGSFGTCKYKYKRTSTTNPNVAGCL